MCGRLACTLNPDEIACACSYQDKNNTVQKPDWLPSYYDYKPFYNGPPTTKVATLALKEHFVNTADEEICLVAMHWGMLPPFKTEVSGTFHTHNARIESIMDSALYRPSLLNGKRCIVVAEGYYEWQTTKGENNKQPYYVYQEKKDEKEDSSKERHLIKLAGLFNAVKEGELTKYTCTILTKESDKTMSWMHHRMPIILSTPQEVNDWLYHKNTSYQQCLSKFAKESEKCMVDFYMVDKQYVNKSTCNDPKCMMRFSVKRKNTLDNWLKPKKSKLT